MEMRNGLRAAGLLVLACLAGLAQAWPGQGPPPVDLLGTTPDGEEIRISDHRGQVLVVSFWASWCGYCRKQFALLDHVQQAVGRERLRVVVVNFKEPASEYRRIRRALRDSPVTWTHDADGALSEAFGVNSVPHMFVFDKAGALATVSRGYSEARSAATIALLNGLLAQPAPEPRGPTPPQDAAPQAQEPAPEDA